MANNIAIGANAVVAKTGISTSFATAGITTSNTAVIYEVGNPNKSYVPGRSINAITAFASEKGYYIIALQAMDLTAFVVPPIAETVTPETIVWSQLDDATNGAGGDLTCTTASGAAGGTATKKLVKANGNYVQMVLPATISDSEAAVLALVEDNDASYVWGGFESLTSVYWNIDALKANKTSTAGSPTNLGTAAGGNTIRLEIANTNDVLVKKSTDGSTFTTLTTLAGTLTGVTDIFVKGVFAVPFVGAIINNATGAGLTTI